MPAIRLRDLHIDRNPERAPNYSEVPLHGIRQDTNNQLKLPDPEQQTSVHKIIPVYMWTLIVAEIGGFAILFWGVIIEVGKLG